MRTRTKNHNSQSCPCDKVCPCHKPSEIKWYHFLLAILFLLSIPVIALLSRKIFPIRKEYIEVNGQMCEIELKCHHLGLAHEECHEIAICPQK